MTLLLTLASLLWGYMSLWFIVSLIVKRNDVADIAWGLGFVLITWSSFFLSHEATLRGVLASLLVTLWGTRLSWHIYKRNKGKKEDVRYATWRNEWGSWFLLRSYLQIFMLQGILLFLVVSPLFVISASHQHSLMITDIVGILIWSIGFFFEAVGDKQLSNFLRNPENKGRLIQTGLWRYTRHPNYFGEVTLWWGLWVIALPHPFGLLSLVGPLTITFLITRVSGIPLLEKNMASHPEFPTYKAKTSVFFPLPPKS